MVFQEAGSQRSLARTPSPGTTGVPRSDVRRTPSLANGGLPGISESSSLNGPPTISDRGQDARESRHPRVQPNPVSFRAQERPPESSQTPLQAQQDLILRAQDAQRRRIEGQKWNSSRDPPAQSKVRDVALLDVPSLTPFQPSQLPLPPSRAPSPMSSSETRSPPPIPSSRTPSPLSRLEDLSRAVSSTTSSVNSAHTPDPEVAESPHPTRSSSSLWKSAQTDNTQGLERVHMPTPRPLLASSSSSTPLPGHSDTSTIESPRPVKFPTPRPRPLRQTRKMTVENPSPSAPLNAGRTFTLPPISPDEQSHAAPKSARAVGQKNRKGLFKRLLPWKDAPNSPRPAPAYLDGIQPAVFPHAVSSDFHVTQSAVASEHHTQPTYEEHMGTPGVSELQTGHTGQYAESASGRGVDREAEMSEEDLISSYSVDLSNKPSASKSIIGNSILDYRSRDPNVRVEKERRTHRHHNEDTGGNTGRAKVFNEDRHHHHHQHRDRLESETPHEKIMEAGPHPRYRQDDDHRHTSDQEEDRRSRTRPSEYPGRGGHRRSRSEEHNDRHHRHGGGEGGRHDSVWRDRKREPARSHSPDPARKFRLRGRDQSDRYEERRRRDRTDTHTDRHLRAEISDNEEEVEMDRPDDSADSASDFGVESQDEDEEYLTPPPIGFLARALEDLPFAPALSEVSLIHLSALVRASLTMSHRSQLVSGLPIDGRY